MKTIIIIHQSNSQFLTNSIIINLIPTATCKNRSIIKTATYIFIENSKGTATWKGSRRRGGGGWQTARLAVVDDGLRGIAGTGGGGRWRTSELALGEGEVSEDGGGCCWSQRSQGWIAGGSSGIVGGYQGAAWGRWETAFVWRCRWFGRLEWRVETAGGEWSDGEGREGSRSTKEEDRAWGGAGWGFVSVLYKIQY
ncbi:unnamed protein product [Linum trigynum]|uniref:Uncharacterized protein n=1 Tax=Linum trigynum TaxID=586398 RepID=A0AAV2CJS7_9ROSI